MLTEVMRTDTAIPHARRMTGNGIVASVPRMTRRSERQFLRRASPFLSIICVISINRSLLLYHSDCLYRFHGLLCTKLGLENLLGSLP